MAAERLDLARALALAFAQIDAGRHDEARRLARQIEKQRPDLPGLAYLNGLVALAEGDGARAARHLAKALSQTPEAPPLLLAMARAQAMQGRDESAEAHYRHFLAVAPDSAAGRGELSALLQKRGILLRDGGRNREALPAFVEAASVDPSSPTAAWLLAEVQRTLGDNEAAAAGYRRVLALDPEDRFGAVVALAALGAGPAPERAPDAFVRQLFDDYAEVFDRKLVDGLRYRAPALLLAAIRATFGDGPFDVFDAGCGTGLMGVELRPLARRLDGADLSPRMLEKAGARGIYDQLQAGDLAASLAARPACYDLVVAADVFVYIGDLLPSFRAAAAALKPGGGFAFTVEELADAEGWRLHESHRYAHSAAYLRDTAGEAGFATLRLDSVSTREEGGVPVPGLLAVLKRNP